MLAKLTVCGMGWAADDSFSFIPQALHSQITPIAHSANGNISKFGWYGASRNDAEAITAFKAVGREDVTLYINAQKELGVLYFVAAGSKERTDVEWITRFFQGLSHYHNVLSSQVDTTNQIGQKIQADVKEHLLDMLDTDGASALFYDLDSTNCLTMKKFSEQT